MIDEIRNYLIRFYGDREHIDFNLNGFMVDLLDASGAVPPLGR